MRCLRASCTYAFLLALSFGSLHLAAQTMTNTTVAQSVVSTAQETSGLLRRPGQEMRIGEGDVLDVTVIESPDLSAKVRVDEDGNVLLPLTGTVHVAGLSIAETAVAIRKRLIDGRYVRDPLVTVTMAEYPTAGVSVLGEVKKPGIYVSMGAHRLDDYLSLAEGLTQYASSRISVAHRATPETPEFVSYNSTAMPRPGSNPVIRPGDTIHVLRAGEIYVIGDVVRPGGFLMDHDEHLSILQALALAQGSNHTAALKHAVILRKTNDGRSQVPVDVAKVLSSRSNDLLMQDDDILFVPTSKSKATMSRALDALVQGAVGTATYRTF